ncbi:MAG: CYTH domain-containing protein [bacterium]|nr:CYTH domain-containing protein [bacterium]
MSKRLKLTVRKGRNEEREIKVQISKEQYDKLLGKSPLYSKQIKQVNQKDIYYDREDLYLTNLNRGLRVRFKGNTPELLEFKSLFYNPYTQNNNPWFIEEIAFPFPLEVNNLEKLFSLLVRLNLLSPIEVTYYSFEPSHFPRIEQILLNLNLKPMIVVSKKRVGYEDGKVRYLFDYIEGLGYFLEIESEGEDPLKILNRLQIEDYRIVRNGYNDMLATKIVGYVPNEEKQKKFKENPSWNILPTEKELVAEMLSCYR